MGIIFLLALSRSWGFPDWGNICNQIIGCMCSLILIGKGRSRTRQVQSVMAVRHRVWIGINKHIDVRGSRYLSSWQGGKEGLDRLLIHSPSPERSHRQKKGTHRSNSCFCPGWSCSCWYHRCVIRTGQCPQIHWYRSINIRGWKMKDVDSFLKLRLNSFKPLATPLWWETPDFPA